MVNLVVFFSLLGVIVVNYIASGRLNRNTLALRNSIFFCVNSVFLVILINWSLNITPTDNLSSSLGLDKIIAFHSIAVSVRNTVIIVSLFYLAYGTYKEYFSSRKKFVAIIAFLLFILSILYLVGSFVAGSFII
jgi:hypothetical protein